MALTQMDQANWLNKIKAGSRDRQIYYLLFALLVFIILYFIPNGRLFIYPLSLFSTWFHEVGHALAALLLGGRVNGIQIFTNLSGATNISIPVGTSNFTQALIAIGGPIMPAFFGALLIMSGRNEFTAKLACWVLSGLVLLTALLSVNSPSVGMSILVLMCAFFFYASSKLDHEILKILVNLLGIQATVSIFNTFDYLSKSTASLNGQKIISDTGEISNLIGLPSIFWAILLTTISFAIMALAFLYSFGIIFKNKKIG